jgi:glycine reductase
MSGTPTRVVLYLNQFFGQMGGEEAANTTPRLVHEVVGPGRALVSLLEPDEVLAGTIVCGDSYFGDQPEQAAAECLDLLRQLDGDMLLAGPAFNAGRYGVACGALCQLASKELGMPAVSGMYEENPGVELYRRDVLIVRTGATAVGMRDALQTMLGLAHTLCRGELPGRPSQAGYFPQGRTRHELAEQPAAERTVSMLLAKLAGQPFETEVPLPVFEAPAAPAPLADLRSKVVALITDGGLVPAGNPDKLEVSAASKFGAYSIDGVERLEASEYDVSHGGYDNRYVKANPNRLVPVDVARELEREGRIGRVYERFLTTTGLSNPVQNSRRLGREMAEHLKAAGVDAVILTST